MPSGPAAGLRLFDAKFRVQAIDNALDENSFDDDATAPVSVRQGTFKREDLYKMRAYRDAIPRARTARALYPGSEDRFYLIGDSPWDGVGAMAISQADPKKCRSLVDFVASRNWEQ